MSEPRTPPRLLLLTQYFVPEMGAPQVRLSELGERLVELGWTVEALTAVPNYPTGRVFPGYSRWRPRIETVGRIRVARVPMFAAKTGIVKRLLSYGSFVVASALLGPALCSPPSIIFVESPPLFVGFSARFLSLAWGAPYVFNVSDLWPESAIRMGVLRRGVIANLMERFELSFYRGAAGVTGQTEETVASIRRRAPGVQTEVITNGVDPTRFGRHLATGEARALLGSEPGPVFLYAGLLGWAQGLGQVLDLARELPEEAPGRFVLVGDGPEREQLAARIKREGLRRVRLLPAQPREAVPALLSAADGAIITLGLHLPGAVPSKIYEAMASELPILLVATGEAALRVERAGCGLAVPPGHAGSLRAAYQRLAGDAALRRKLGDAGRRAAEGEYDRAAIARKLDAFLSRCLGEGAR